MTSTQGLLGILKMGTILPSAHDRIGLPNDFPAATFFQFSEAYVPANVGQGCSAAMRKALQSLQTTVWCVMLSGCITRGHTKYKWASTWIEMALASRAGLARSKSTDKRWAIRVDLAQIQWIVLMS